MISKRCFIASSNCAAWTPEIIDTNLWLDASDSTTITIDTGVSEWLDKSGEENNALQTASSSQPVFGEIGNKPSILFDGLDDFLNIDGSIFVGTNFTLFVVVTKPNQYVSYTEILGGTGSSSGTNLILGWHNNGNSLLLSYFSNDILYTDITANGTMVAITAYQGTNSRKLYLNNVVVGSDANNSLLTSFAGSAFGRYSSYCGAVNIHEVILITGNVSDDIRQKVEGYLAWKWKNVGSLPESHPYKLYKPIV